MCDKNYKKAIKIIALNKNTLIKKMQLKLTILKALEYKEMKTFFLLL